MALIKCPECGREGVSSFAKACPQCGFDVNEYYKEVTLEQQDNIFGNVDNYETKIIPENETIESNNIEQEKNQNTQNQVDNSALGSLCLFSGVIMTVILFILFFMTWKSIFIFLSIPFSFFGLYGFAKFDPRGYHDCLELDEQRRQAKKFTPNCPVCNSHNTKRISMISRGISVELMGLASDSIGKQYICMSCKHKW